ncbi:MAG TPA: 30S ribosomal protein S18 [Candidatus Coprosoma intestinipullorum]|uniref:Small ribosomal subunit protein bS18 n=1 Tax=Candidatus Coprosoma intestinipullorum TaxID=2840752 RepID=A0A9D0ZRX3_9FIRM|nr:30S ribosomal protein S18 [Candidatus Coprosoma intestinipullorum]
MAEYRRKKKKVCQLCAGKHVDYKDENLKKYISNDKGKILPRRITGTCARHQRYIAGEVKKARFIALLPFVK